MRFRIFSQSQNSHLLIFNTENRPLCTFPVHIVACAIVLGTLFGNINIFGFSLGNSGGMLCAEIIIGLLAKFLFDNKSMQQLVLTQFRNFGLVLFFVGNGVPAGMELHNGFDLKILFYGAILTIVPIVVGYLLNKLIIGGRESKTQGTVLCAL